VTIKKEGQGKLWEVRKKGDRKYRGGGGKDAELERERSSLFSPLATQLRCAD